MEPIVENLIPAIWLIWIVYWMIAARGNKAAQRVESAASRLGHLVPLAIAAWLLFARTLPGCTHAGSAILPGFLCDNVIAPGRTVYLTGIVVLVGGLAFSVWARRWLGRNWSGVVTLKQDHELVRGGPYRYVRHPIYTGILFGFAGSAIARDEWRGVFAVAIAYLALWRKLKLEERWMVERFGDAYRKFQADVPALIPNPFRSPRTAGNPR
ncbi:MAG TPA: isoprenylcysteine carboxylmethyltransferase family protein [Rudaea sp.]|nr:isoprenylcysteine carboxylmethyltransferase family protein [Rudaea sp.]